MAVRVEVLEELSAQLEIVAPVRPAERATPRASSVRHAARRSTDLLDACAARALALWPRLSRVHVLKAHGDPWRIARLVARRTSEPPEVIVAMLTGEPIRPAPASDLDAETAEA